MDRKNELLKSIKDLWDECPDLEFGNLIAGLTFGKYGTHNPLCNSTTDEWIKNIKETHLNLKRLRGNDK
jgi:hypothetical protein